MRTPGLALAGVSVSAYGPRLLFPKKAGRRKQVPTDIAWLPDGTFFVSDGYGNSRVAKFDKNGKFLMTWREKGKRPGQFNLPHAIETDRNRRVYVADRSNERIQIFDENGKYLDEWPNIRHANYIMITADQRLWVADGVTDKFLQSTSSKRGKGEKSV